MERQPYKLLLIKSEGAPTFMNLPLVDGRHAAVVKAQKLINENRAKVVVVYRGNKPTQLLVYRPATYVHLERI